MPGTHSKKQQLKCPLCGERIPDRLGDHLKSVHQVQVDEVTAIIQEELLKCIMELIEMLAPKQKGPEFRGNDGEYLRKPKPWKGS